MFFRAWYTLSVLIRAVATISLSGLNMFASQEVGTVVQGTDEKSGLLKALFLEEPPLTTNTPSPIMPFNLELTVVTYFVVNAELFQ